MAVRSLGEVGGQLLLHQPASVGEHHHVPIERVQPLRDPGCGCDRERRNLLVVLRGLKPVKDGAQAEELPVQPDGIPADRPEPPLFAAHALVKNVVLDLIELIGQASASLDHRGHDLIDDDVEQLDRGEDTATLRSRIARAVRPEDRVTSAAHEQARSHDEVEPSAGVDFRALASLADQIGYDAADMACLDDQALMQVAREGGFRQLRGSQLPLGNEPRKARVIQVEVQPSEAFAEAPRMKRRLLGFDKTAPAGLIEPHRPKQARQGGLVAQKTRRRAGGDCRHNQNTWRRMKNSVPAIRMAAGSVVTQASAMLRTVAICNPEPFAAIVPATPDDRMCVVETGRP